MNSGIEPSEKGTQGHLIGVRGQRKEEMRQQTDHVRQGTKDGQETEGGHRTGDRETEEKV